MPDHVPAPSVVASANPAVGRASSSNGWCCSSCGGFVRSDATTCKHCSSPLVPAIPAQPEQIAIRWKLFWLWVLAGLIGLLVATIGYQYVPFDLRYPRLDEDIWLEEPWRLAVLNGVYFTPISLIQWLALRSRVPRAWWGLFATLGSVIVFYPSSIWTLWTLNQWDLAWLVWFLGLGGSGVYVVVQMASLYVTVVSEHSAVK